MFDNRLLRVGVEIGKRIVWFEGLSIEATITKVANEVANEANVKITGISKTQRDQILTETTPWMHASTRKSLIIEAGRASYGTSRIYTGDIQTVGVSQPPDIAIDISAKTNAWNKLQVISKGYAASVSSKVVAADIADSMGLTLVWEATDKQIGSYSFTGSKGQQLGQLGQLGQVNAYVDDDKLVVKDLGKPLGKVATVAILDSTSGMVGIPELTEQGIRVKMMFEPQSRCGGAITVDSKRNPGANGTYTIYKMTYDLANRQEPFYTTIEAYRKGRYKV